jgi:hypothetical protein
VRHEVRKPARLVHDQDAAASAITLQRQARRLVFDAASCACVAAVAMPGSYASCCRRADMHHIFCYS